MEKKYKGPTAAKPSRYAAKKLAARYGTSYVYSGYKVGDILAEEKEAPKTPAELTREEIFSEEAKAKLRAAGISITPGERRIQVRINERGELDPKGKITTLHVSDTTYRELSRAREGGVDTRTSYQKNLQKYYERQGYSFAVEDGVLTGRKMGRRVILGPRGEITGGPIEAELRFKGRERPQPAITRREIEEIGGERAEVAGYEKGYILIRPKDVVGDVELVASLGKPTYETSDIRFFEYKKQPRKLIMESMEQSSKDAQSLINYGEQLKRIGQYDLGKKAVLYGIATKAGIELIKGAASAALYPVETTLAQFQYLKPNPYILLTPYMPFIGKKEQFVLLKEELFARPVETTLNIAGSALAIKGIFKVSQGANKLIVTENKLMFERTMAEWTKANSAQMSLIESRIVRGRDILTPRGFERNIAEWRKAKFNSAQMSLIKSRIVRGRNILAPRVEVLIETFKVENYYRGFKVGQNMIQTTFKEGISKFKIIDETRKFMQKPTTQAKLTDVYITEKPIKFYEPIITPETIKAYEPLYIPKLKPRVSYIPMKDVTYPYIPMKKSFGSFEATKIEFFLEKPTKAIARYNRKYGLRTVQQEITPKFKLPKAAEQKLITEYKMISLKAYEARELYKQIKAERMARTEIAHTIDKMFLSKKASLYPSRLYQEQILKPQTVLKIPETSFKTGVEFTRMVRQIRIPIVALPQISEAIQTPKISKKRKKLMASLRIPTIKMMQYQEILPLRTVTPIRIQLPKKAQVQKQREKLRFALPYFGGGKSARLNISPPPPPPKIIILPPRRIKEEGYPGKRRKKMPYITFPRYKYTPSIFPAYFNLRGMMPKIPTGFGRRPMLRF